MGIKINDVAADVKALRSIARAIRNLVNAMEEEEHFIKAFGKCGLCGADIGLKFSAILTREHGVKSIALHAVDTCCRGRTHDHLQYIELHPDHQ